MKNRKKCSLVVATEGDISLISSWWSNGQVMAAVGYPLGLTMSKEEVRRIVNDYQMTENSEFLLIINEKNQRIGEFCYRQVRQDVWTFDLKIGQIEQQGRGYGRLGLSAGLKRIFENTQAKKIEISVASDNVKALSLYTTMGFKKISILRDSWVDQCGKDRDSVILEFYNLNDCRGV